MGLIIFIIFVVIIIIALNLALPKKVWFDKEGKRLSQKFKSGWGLIAFILVILLILVSQGIVIVHPGDQVVKFNRFSVKGSISTMEQGFHIIFPFIYKLDKYDVRIQDYTMSIAKGEGRMHGDDSVWSPTKEGLQVGVDLSVWYRINPETLAEMHTTIGKNYESKIIRPAIRSLIRNTVAQYKVMELYSEKRAEVQNFLFEDLKQELAQRGFIVEKLLLRDIAFPKLFEKAIEEKQIAEQQAQKMVYINEKEELEAERKAIEAGGEVARIRAIGKAIKANPGYSNWLYVNKLSGNIKVIVADQTTIMNLEGLINDGKR
ncbi:prohibitin family protein [bacterium]|nr:prohibitin family protein [bacterium]